jgi:uncharacterized protein (TIGR03435 family)
MQELDDIALLRQYTEQNSEEAFAALVTRHINKVYSVALRHTRNPHSAEEITQAVFVILAKKSSQLGKKVFLSGWLYETSRLTAVTFIRSEIRRARREQEAYMETLLNETASDVWPQIAPLLDEAMAGLGATDRHAVVLRFFDGKSMKEVGAVLGASEDAAKMRLNRAVEKLREFFTKRGVVLPGAVLTAAISANSVQAAPMVLAKTATAVAFAKGMTASSSTLTLIKGALKIMAWTKAKTAVVVGVVVLLAAGTSTVTINTIRERTIYPWQTPRVQPGMLERVPAQVRIIPSNFSEFGGWGYDRRDGNRKVIGIGAPVKEILQAAYGTLTSRTVFPSALPKERYDFIANLPTGSEQALQKEIEKKFSFVGKKVIRQTDVLILTIKNAHAPGLKPTAGRGSRDDSVIGPGQCSIPNQPLSGLADLLESYFEVPVIDHSRIATRFDIDLKWDEQEFRKNPEGLKQALLDELGLELAPGSEPIEMLVVDKTR